MHLLRAALWGVESNADQLLYDDFARGVAQWATDGLAAAATTVLNKI
jgi:hypothetical protein